MNAEDDHEWIDANEGMNDKMNVEKSKYVVPDREWLGLDRVVSQPMNANRGSSFPQPTFPASYTETELEDVGEDEEGGSNRLAAEDEFFTMTPTLSRILAREMPVDEPLAFAAEAAATTGGVWLTSSRSLSDEVALCASKLVGFLLLEFSWMGLLNEVKLRLCPLLLLSVATSRLEAADDRGSGLFW